MRVHPSAKMDLEVKASGRSKTHYDLKLSSDFWLQRAFLHLCSVFSLVFYSEGSLPLFLLAIIIPLRCYQETKTGYLPRFCCHFQEQMGVLVVNSSAGVHLFLASGNTKRRLADCKCQTWSPSISYLTPNTTIHIEHTITHAGLMIHLICLSFLQLSFYSPRENKLPLVWNFSFNLPLASLDSGE